MVFNTIIINDIKTKSGLKFDKTTDFSVLSTKIFKATGRTIGITTLKRLFNYIDDNRNTSNYTLNTIAIYLGYDSWIDYSSVKETHSEWGYKDDAIYISNVPPDTKIRLEYLDRKVVVCVAEYQGTRVLKVVESHNSSLAIGDILFVHKIKIGEILEAEKVVRGSMTGNYKTRAEITSISVQQN